MSRNYQTRQHLPWMICIPSLSLVQCLNFKFEIVFEVVGDVPNVQMEKSPFRSLKVFCGTNKEKTKKDEQKERE